LFQLKQCFSQNYVYVVKRFSCFSKSQAVSAVYTKLLLFITLSINFHKQTWRKKEFGAMLCPIRQALSSLLPRLQLPN